MTRAEVHEPSLNVRFSVQATVRLLINYNTSHKTVVRVNPRLPLQLLLPAICDKCEFNKETTVLLRDSQSRELLDLTKSLNDYELREVFAEDRTANTGTLKTRVVKSGWYDGRCCVKSYGVRLLIRNIDQYLAKCQILLSH